MGSKRTLILIAALAIGAIAAFSLYSYVNGVENKALEKSQPVDVYVVAQDIKANTTGEQVLSSKLIVGKRVPKDVRPAAALVDETTIRGKVAKTDLVVGQIVVPNMFVDQTQASSTWSERLAPDQVAIQVNLDQTRGLVGMLQPGDRVTMLATVKCKEEALLEKKDPDVACKGQEESSIVRFLYSNVSVLNIGSGSAVPSVAPTAGSTAAATAVPAASPVITFNVPLEAAKRIALANGNLWLALEPKDFVPTGDYRNATALQGLFVPPFNLQVPPESYSPYGAPAKG